MERSIAAFIPPVFIEITPDADEKDADENCAAPFALVLASGTARVSVPLHAVRVSVSEPVKTFSLVSVGSAEDVI